MVYIVYSSFHRPLTIRKAHLVDRAVLDSDDQVADVAALRVHLGDGEKPGLVDAQRERAGGRARHGHARVVEQVRDVG
jgi:hypothetical protein